MSGDEFQGDSGLKDDYDGVIVKAEFEQNKERMNYQLVLNVLADDGEEVQYIYSCGSKERGFTSYDGGESVQGPSAKTKYHDNSAIQQLIYRVMATDAANELRERSATLYDHKGPFHAGLWVGLKFHWDVVTEKQRRPDDSGEWKDTDVQVSRPTKFLGVVGEGKGGATPAIESAPAATSDTSAATPAAQVADGVSEGDLKTLKRLAILHDTHEEFVDAVMEEKDGTGQPMVKNKGIMKLVGKKAWYQAERA